MRFAVASCPASISFLFQSHTSKNPATTGSIGIGATISEHVYARVQHAKQAEIVFNGAVTTIPPVTDVITALTHTPLSIHFTSSLPLGYGFGLSSACTLSAAYAVNTLLHTPHTKEDIALRAHIAELTHHTGLGSVATQMYGGLLRRTTAGYPAQREQLSHPPQSFFAILVTRLETSSVLSNPAGMETINHTATDLLQQIEKEPLKKLSQCLDYSYVFAKKAGLLTHKTVNTLIANIRAQGGHATMALLGHTILTDILPTIPHPYPTMKLSIVKATPAVYTIHSL